MIFFIQAKIKWFKVFLDAEQNKLLIKTKYDQE